MFYPKNADQDLSSALFQSPTKEYRGAPFWSWNDVLDKDELCRQIDELHEMGFSGFLMHPRSGLATPYLSEEFMALVKACNEKAKQEGMLCWLYDEDRFPSGFAGGMVTKEKRFRLTRLRFTTDETCAELSTVYGNDGEDYLVAAFDIQLNTDGTLQSYESLSEGHRAKGTAWYAVCEKEPSDGWYNGQAYVDVMNKEAIARFIHITMNAYEKAVGGDFGSSVPAVFTDEPRHFRAQPKGFSHSKEDIRLAWTPDFPETFAAANGFDIVPHLPELVWQLPDGKPSRARYLYHDHRAQRTIDAFMIPYHEWCREHGLLFTGHLLGENNLNTQTESVADHMRFYRHFDIPGMDLLMDLLLPNIAKQVQSIVHQEGREAMISELYGVTGWDYGFRQHKLQGDWQAALGVTVRTPHLSWYSMRGSAKRDYPASFHYQSPWYKDYPYLEDHYARINTAMTRGKPVVEIAVLHPIESNWLSYGAADLTGDTRDQLIRDFETTCRWLLYGSLDFDYLNESSLPQQYRMTEDNLLQVGEMGYKTVIVSGMLTIRSSTVKILTEFRRKGGKVLFLGEPPKFVDAGIPQANDPLFALIAASVSVPFTKTALLNTLEEERKVEIRLASGLRGEDWIYQLRQDGENRWLFLATAVRPEKAGKKGSFPEMDGKEILLTLRGCWKPTLYDTLSGDISPIPYQITASGTEIRARLYAYDSMLLKLEPTSESGSTKGRDLMAQRRTPCRIIDYKKDVAVRRTEDNVVLLDMAQWSEDGIEFLPTDELRTIDTALRKKYRYPSATGGDIQPWCIPKTPCTQFVWLKFLIHTQFDADTRLAYEAAEAIWLDGKEIPRTVNGYYTDRSIISTPLPTLTRGSHEITVKVPFGKRESLENLFLLGDFDVRVSGIESTLLPPSRRLPFADLSKNGMPFYGAAVEYELPFELERDADVLITAQNYRGALLNVKVDGNIAGRIVFAPYRLELGRLKRGKHTVTVIAVLTRHNSFACMHNVSGDVYTGGKYWFPKGDLYAYEYQTVPTGILQSPRLEIYE